MRRIAVVFLLAGCVDQGPPPPSPQLQKVIAACEAGNQTACTTVAEVRERQRSERGNMQSSAPVPQIYIPPMNVQDYQTAATNFGGQRLTTTCTVYGNIVTCY